MQTLLEFLAHTALLVALIVAPVAWFRIVSAKTRANYLRNTALFVGPILLAIALAQAAGLMPTMAMPTEPPPRVEDLVKDMPVHQLVLLGLAAAVWVGGGNLLFYLHRRRLGRKWWQMLNPLEPPFKQFNAQEWWGIAALAVTSLGLGALAMLR